MKLNEKLRGILGENICKDIIITFKNHQGVLFGKLMHYDDDIIVITLYKNFNKLDEGYFNGPSIVDTDSIAWITTGEGWNALIQCLKIENLQRQLYIQQKKEADIRDAI